MKGASPSESKIINKNVGADSRARQIMERIALIYDKYRHAAEGRHMSVRVNSM